MKMRRLGAQGPTVSAIGLGCMRMSNYQGSNAAENRDSEKDSIATIHASLDAGINLLDTGDFYGMGHNEMLVGRAIKGRREEAVISVKFGAQRSPTGAFLGFDMRPTSVKNFASYSLQRLGVDVIDIYQPGRIDPMVSRQETARPLLTPGEVMQLPPTDEIVMVAGTPPIRATKARYFEDARFMERILTPPDPAANPAAANPLSDDWSSRIVPTKSPNAPATASGTDSDPANAGIRREPELPKHEEIVASSPPPEQEFDILDDEPDVDAAKARALRQRMRMVARQASLDPGDGIEL